MKNIALIGAGGHCKVIIDLIKCLKVYNIIGIYDDSKIGEFASFNYQISLYMITPDAYAAFMNTGRKNINALTDASANAGVAVHNAGAFLIAQSGGINNTNDKRAPGFTFDYGIDNLSFKNMTSGKASETATNTTEIKFTIIEPYGFSFITKLKQASDALSEMATGSGNSSPENPTKQFFILGIKFYGYDIEGNVLTGSENFASSKLDPDATGNGLFARYYDIIISSIKLTPDAKNMKSNTAIIINHKKNSINTFVI